MEDAVEEAEGPVERILAKYLQAAEAGQAPARDEFLARHPQHAEELREFLADEEELCRLVHTDAPGPVPGASPRTFGDYELLEEVARGGMGVVYKARHTRLNRVVALKMILAGQFASTEDVKRFQIEAQNAAQLDHPHIVAIYEVGRCRGRHFYTMKWVEGGSLSRAMARFSSEPRAAVELMATVARAVHYAHERGILHRDIKPGNILLDGEGRPRVTDFGLARRLEQDPGVTLSGAIVGSPRYMAPEQAAGQKVLTVAADVYGLGAVLYEMLTGSPPIEGSSVLDTLRQVREVSPPRPFLLNRRLDRDLDTVCLKCLEKDPRKRYASAEALADDLERWLRGEPLRARPTGPLGRASRWCRRNPAPAITVGALVALLLTIGSAAWRLHRATVADDARRIAGEREQLVRLARISDMQAHSGLLADQRNEARQAMLWFAYAARTAAGDPERLTTNQLRVRAWAARVATPLAAFTRGDEPSMTSFDPTGRLLLCIGESGRPAVWDWAAEQQLTLPGESLSAKLAAWSPDGQYLAFSDGDSVQVCPLRGSGEPYKLPVPGPISCLCFDPAEPALLAIAGRDVRFWDVASRNRRTVDPLNRTEDSNQMPALSGAGHAVLAFSPRGDRLAVVEIDREVLVFTMDKAVPRPNPLVLSARHHPGTELSDPAPLPPMFQDEGRTLVTVVTLPHGGRCLTWSDVETGAERYTALCEGGGVIAASPDGSRLVASGGGQTRLFGDGAVVEATWPGLRATSASFTPDGRRLVLGCDDAQVRVWACDDGAFFESPIPHQSPVRTVAINCEGRVATGQSGGLLRVWTPGSGGSPTRSGVQSGDPLPQSAYRPLARVSPDGKYFLPSAEALRRDAAAPELRVYDLFGGAPASSPLKVKKEDTAWDARWSPDGTRVAVAREKAIEFWDWRAARIVVPPVPLPSPVQSFCYGPDAAAGAAVLCMDGQLQLIEPAGGRVLAQVENASEPATRNQYQQYLPPFSVVRFDPIGRLLVTAGGNAELRFRDARSLALRLPLIQHERDCHDVSFSASGDLLAIVGDRSVRVLSTATGRRAAPPLSHPDYVFGAQFSPDGNWLLTACRDGVARLWDWRNGRNPVTFQHAGPLYAAAFAGHGRWVVTVGADEEARCWETTTGTPVAPPVRLNGVGWGIWADDRSTWLSGGVLRKSIRVECLERAELWSPDDQCLRCELVAGQMIDEGGAVTSLSPAQWLDRWRELRRRRPEFPRQLIAAGPGPIFAAPRGPAESFAMPTSRYSDWPMWAGSPTRNLLSAGRMPPTQWDVETNSNIRWVAQLGSKSYGEPVISQGVVYVGTNNESTRNPKTLGEDGGELMALDASTGEFLWQRHSPKLAAGRVNDWPSEGLCSPVYVESGRLWYCTNRCEVVCLDVSAANRQRGEPPVLWSVDMMNMLGVFPHNMTRCSIAAYKDYIYVVTANGVDDTHKHVVAPRAPDIVCFNKNTGQVVWSDNTPGAYILHGQWASPAITTVNGTPLVIVPLGDGWVYAYHALTGKIVWRFDLNPKGAVYPRTRNEVLGSPCIVGNRMYIANGQDPEHGEGFGHIYCVDITKEGDISKELDAHPSPRPPIPEGPTAIQGSEGRPAAPNPNSAVIWDYEAADLNGDGKIDRSEHMNRTISTCCVTPNGLCFVPDFSGFLHCFDARTGQLYWTFDLEAAVWGSCLWADGKVYLADEDGDVRIFAADKELRLLGEANMGSGIYSTPVFVHGTLYLMTRDKLFAIGSRY